MPIYPGRREGTWRVTVWSRRKQREAIVEGSESDARDHEARMRLELRARGSAASQRSAKTFFALCQEDYAPFALEHLGPKTWRTVRRYQCATLTEFFGSHRLDELSTELVDDFKSHRLRSVRASAVNAELRVLRTMLTWAREDRKYPVAEIHIRSLPEGGHPRVLCWTTAEVERLLATSQRNDRKLWPMILFLLNTGVRKGEAIAAEWSWVDERRRMLRIPVTEFWRPKNKKPREVPIGDVLWEMLRRRVRWSRWIFPSARDERFEVFPDERFRNVRRAAKLAGSPHVCRHTFASHFLQSRPDLFLLASILGHSQVRVTELYTHLLPDHHERARNAVNLGGHPGDALAKRAAS